MKLIEDSEDMITALDWMDVEWYTLVVCVGNLTFVFCNCFLFLFLSLIFSFFIFSFNSWTLFSIFLCNSKTFCINNLDLSPLIPISVTYYEHTYCYLKWLILVSYFKIWYLAWQIARHFVPGCDLWKIRSCEICVRVPNFTVSYPERWS